MTDPAAGLTPGRLAKLRAELESMCIALSAGDLEPRRTLYVVFFHELRLANFPVSLGVVGTWLNAVAAADGLGGHWRGPGPTVGLNIELMAARVAADVGAAAADDGGWPNADQVAVRVTWQLARAICLHELAHLLADRRFAAVTVPPPAAVEQWRSALSADLSTPSVRGDFRIGDSIFTHDRQFVRAVLHLGHRDRLACRRAGASATYTDDMVCNTAHYGMRPVGEYAAALGDEPARLAARSVRAVLATPPPPAFDRLWRDDMERWPEWMAAAMKAGAS